MVFNPLLLRALPYAIGFAVLLAAATGIYFKGHAHGAEKVQKAFDAYRMDAQSKALQAVAKAQAAQHAMNTAFTTMETDYAAKIQALGARARVLSERLRGTPVRGECTSLPDTAAFEHSGTGVLVSDTDGEHLIALAKNADAIAEQLKTCIAKYEAARQLTDAR